MERLHCIIPREGPRGLSREYPPYPLCRKRRLIGALCRNHRIERLVPCRCLDGHVKVLNPAKCLWRWEPDRRYFFSPPAHLCAVTCMTEISLIVPLNNQFTSPHCIFNNLHSKWCHFWQFYLVHIL